MYADRKIKKKNLIRTRKIIIPKEINTNYINLNGKLCINFSSNDYLGLTKHPEITKAFTKAVKNYGFGSGSSALMSGYTDAHYETEKQFEKWLKVDRVILFNSGYQANIGIIRALVNRSDIIISDKLCHASILDGIQISRARHYRYHHCDIEHLKNLCEIKKPDLIITESVFSMEGDIAPIKDIIKLSKQYKKTLIIDDAHGIGILGKNGGGIYEQENIQQNQISCLVAPLGKAFNGMGAIVAGRNEVVESILQFSKSYCYTTALPAAICVALQTCLKIIIEDQWRREQLKHNIQFFIHQAREQGLVFSATEETPIKSLIVGDNAKALDLQNFLLTKGFHVVAIRPPTVPENSARLRISLNCLHTEEQIMQLLNCISTRLYKL